jgi:hypothetical protein
LALFNRQLGVTAGAAFIGGVPGGGYGAGLRGFIAGAGPWFMRVLISPLGAALKVIFGALFSPLGILITGVSVLIGYFIKESNKIKAMYDTSKNQDSSMAETWLKARQKQAETFTGVMLDTSQGLGQDPLSQLRFKLGGGKLGPRFVDMMKSDTHWVDTVLTQRDKAGNLLPGSLTENSALDVKRVLAESAVIGLKDAVGREITRLRTAGAPLTETEKLQLEKLGEIIEVLKAQNEQFRQLHKAELDENRAHSDKEDTDHLLRNLKYGELSPAFNMGLGGF